ncbi:MAG: HdeD family acid-resistance protein [Thermomicrobiales bacterium]
MLDILSRHWWLLALRGVIAIIFGICALIWPGLTLTVLVLLFGAYALVDGIFAVIAGIRAVGRAANWWVLLLEGILGIIFGLLTFAWPGITALVLLVFIAVWAVLTGIMEIVTAIQLRREIQGEWLLALSGVLSIIWGIILFVRPGAGALAIAWLIGVFAILFGISLIALAYRLRGLGDRGLGIGDRAPV